MDRSRIVRFYSQYSLGLRHFRNGTCSYQKHILRMSRRKKTDVVIHGQTQPATVDTFIQQAIQNNLPVETMERLFALREKVKAEAAKEAFVRALADFQAECPVIKKTKKVLNKDGNTVRYVYAPIDSIVEQIKRPLGRAGLSYRWETRQEAGKVTAVCFITHVLGHVESTDFTVDVDAAAYMTNPQKTASALTFAKRYSLCNGLGISTGDEDTDAVDVKKEPDAKSPKAQIIMRLRALNEKTGTPEEIREAIKRLTGLESGPETYADIAARLQSIIDENNQQ